MNKSKTLKNYRVLVASLISVFFVHVFIGCNNPIAPDSNVVAAPSGKGSFSLTLTDSSRTILPATPNLNDFAIYNLAFTPINKGVFVSVDRTNGTIASSPVILEPGTYNLVVNAYKDEGKNHLMARGTLNSVTISAGSNTPGAVTLKPQLSGGTGIFKWDINLPEVFIANMTIVSRQEGGTEQATIELSLPKATGSRTLNSGQYSIIVNLEKMDGETLVWNELLYVYQNLESVFSYTFTDAQFVNPLYTVTFDSKGGNPLMGPQSVMHGEVIERPYQPSKDGYNFGGWYADSSASGAPWDFDTAIIESFTLYARWESIPVMGMELTRVSETAPPVKINVNELFKISVGDIITLTADILPANATNPGVTWSSDNPSIVSVNNGVLFARAVGPVSITVTSQENSSIMMQCNIKVYYPVSSATRYQAIPSPYTGKDRIRYSYSHNGNEVYFIHLGELAFIPTFTDSSYHHTEMIDRTLKLTDTVTKKENIQNSVTNNKTEAISIRLV